MKVYKPKDGNIFTLPKSLINGEAVVGSKLYCNRDGRLHTNGEEKDFCCYIIKIFDDSWVGIYGNLKTKPIFLK